MATTVHRHCLQNQTNEHFGVLNDQCKKSHRLADPMFYILGKKTTGQYRQYRFVFYVMFSYIPI